MSNTILQKSPFKNTGPEELYGLYMDAKKHALATGGSAKITNKEGSKFNAYDGYIEGRNLLLIKDKLIVQSWRASDWNEADGDSTLILFFEVKGKDTVLHLTHANLPNDHAKSIADGWHKYYWKPWKTFLSR